jgi:hypothetical protein
VPEEVLLTTEGFQVPVMPLSEGLYSEGTAAPVQIVSDDPKVNDGTTTGLIVTVNVVVVAHCPAPGVNVYTPEFWLSIVDGLHVPVIPFDEVPGSDGTADPAQ